MDVLTISRSLSYSVIVLSFCMKLPQISAIYSSGSSRGLNIRGYWMEISCYLIGTSYGYFHDFHITTYGESILLAMQSTVIIFLAVYYCRQWTLENALLTTTGGSGGALVVGRRTGVTRYGFLSCFRIVAFVLASVVKAVPGAVLYALILSTLPLNTVSKLSQVYSIYRLKSQGDVSMVMWGLAAYGCAARLFTIAVEVKDASVFLNFFISLVLNTVVVLQCLYYGSGTPAAVKKE